MFEKIIDSLGLDSMNFVSAIKIIQAGHVLTSIDFTESNELKLEGETKKRRGRPKLTQAQKDFTRSKREAGKTRSFALGEEPNKRTGYSNRNFNVEKNSASY
jgi:hypothetical protein